MDEPNSSFICSVITTGILIIVKIWLYSLFDFARAIEAVKLYETQLDHGVDMLNYSKIMLFKHI